MALFESRQGQCRIATDPIFLEQVIQDMGESISRSLENPSHVVFLLFLLQISCFIFFTRQDTQEFADLMVADPNLRQLFYAFMVFEGLDMMSVAQKLAVNNHVRRFSHRCKL